MYQHLRSLLFRLDPEEAHRLTLAAVGLSGGVLPARLSLRALFESDDPRLAVEAFGLRFKNPVGLAAGYDKNGAAVRGLCALGFGHVEVGTLTPKPQAGNPRPRVHRVPEVQGLINSLGFPNLGAGEVDGRHWRAQAQATRARVGVNIGKGKDTPLERAAEDYVHLVRRYQPCADYLAVNISSPNTLGLRQLQSRQYLSGLLAEIARARDALTPRVPILVKIAPDLAEGEIDDALDAILGAGLDGVIATNTTISRDGLPERARALKGGLSGYPLRDRATAVIRSVAQRTAGRLPIVGVGGIMQPDDALEKLDAGATLVQVYTGLVYAGPALVRQINRRLLRR